VFYPAVQALLTRMEVPNEHRILTIEPTVEMIIANFRESTSPDPVEAMRSA